MRFHPQCSPDNFLHFPAVLYTAALALVTYLYWRELCSKMDAIMEVIPDSDSNSESNFPIHLLGVVNERNEVLVSAEELHNNDAGEAVSVENVGGISEDEYNDSEPSDYDSLTVEDIEAHNLQGIEIPLENYARDVEHPDDFADGWEWVEKDPGASYGPFTGPSGLMIDVGETPQHYFDAFFDATMWHKIADETNKYARQSLAESRNGRDSIECLDDPQYRRKGRLNMWQDINASDLRIFMAHQIVMGLVRKTKLTNYWNKHSYLHTPFFGTYMNRTTFERILSNIHVADNTTADGNDTLYKIRPFLDMCEANFQHVYKPGREISIDEGSVAFKGRFKYKVSTSSHYVGKNRNLSNIVV